jgi:translation initiation factor 1
VRLRLETRPSGRAVTLVLGLPGGEAEWAALAAALKSGCSTGGGVKDGVIELQGDQREKARAVLAARGIKSR